MSYLSRAYYKVFAWRCNFLTFFVTFLICLIPGHNLENNWLGPHPLNQNCMKNSNLKLNVRYEVHNNVKSNIFNNFAALFSLFYIHQTTFSYVINIYRRRVAPYLNQFFVLFHLAGVSSWTLEDIINFWYGLWREVEILL